jgi:hypothetical protein
MVYSINGNHSIYKYICWLQIQVFHTEERLRRTINLIVDVSDGADGESEVITFTAFVDLVCFISNLKVKSIMQ